MVCIVSKLCLDFLIFKRPLMGRPELSSFSKEYTVHAGSMVVVRFFFLNGD